MTNTNEIDYVKLERISAAEGIPFETLCERVEEGRPLRTLEPITRDWIGYKEVAEILHCSYGTLASHMTNDCKGCRELEYWGVDWKTRSMNENIAEGKRGCGVLFKRSDIEKIMHIRTSARIGIINSLKVFQAMHQGKF